MALIQLDHMGNLKLKEIEIFYLAAKTKSIREVARRLNSTPGQISKTIRGIEKKMGAPLFKRSPSGIVLSENGAEMIGFSEAILDSAYQMETRRKKDDKKTLAVAATPFLLNYLVSFVTADAFSQTPRFSLRLMDLTPDQIIPLGLKGAFEVVFHFGKLDWPQTWQQERVGTMEWVLCAHAKHPALKKPTREEILKYPFVHPTYWTNEGLAKGNDFFEIPFSKRVLGYETSTADAALPLIASTNQLGCMPRILVQRWVDAGLVKILKVSGVKSTLRDLYISVKSDALTANLFESLKSSASARLK